jgi:hypothetical protein
MQHDEEIPRAMGTIIPAIAATALVIIGMYYSLFPPAEAPASVTSEAPRPLLSHQPTRTGRFSYRPLDRPCSEIPRDAL